MWSSAPDHAVPFSTRGAVRPADSPHQEARGEHLRHPRPDESVAALAGDDYEPELEVDLFSLPLLALPLVETHEAKDAEQVNQQPRDRTWRVLPGVFACFPQAKPAKRVLSLDAVRTHYEHDNSVWGIDGIRLDRFQVWSVYFDFGISLGCYLMAVGVAKTDGGRTPGARPADQELPSAAAPHDGKVVPITRRKPVTTDDTGLQTYPPYLAFATAVKSRSFLDGIDLSQVNAADILDSSEREIRMLLAEGWAERDDSKPPGR